MGIKVIVNSPGKNRVSINNQRQETVRTVGVQSPNGLLRNLQDVNVNDLDNNETLVYDAASDEFVVKVLPEINGGSY